MIVLIMILILILIMIMLLGQERDPATNDRMDANN